MCRLESMNELEIRRFDVSDPDQGPIPCAVVAPSRAVQDLPLCLFLYGGGGGRETLVDISPLLADAWASRALPPMVVATADLGPFGFYLDDPERGLLHETFLRTRFLPFLRRSFELSARAVLVGVSMGGYGALKIAFAQPESFVAVAAIGPMIEPSVDAHAVPLRNRCHYPSDVPTALLGPERDAALFGRDHPAARARENAEALRGSNLAIYIDAAGRDCLRAHDGAEFVHRVLWELDVAHEYHLRRDSDHVGPDLAERLLRGFAFVGRHLVGTETPNEQAAGLRAQLAPLFAEAARVDPTVHRTYGVL